MSKVIDVFGAFEVRRKAAFEIVEVCGCIALIPNNGARLFVGVEDPTFFDSRCTRFLGVDYDDLVERTLQGGPDEEILEWCFARGRKPSEEEISIWNAFLSKRGWRDEASDELAAAKERSGLDDRNDIQTWIDLHDAEEGRTPRRQVCSSRPEESAVA